MGDKMDDKHFFKIVFGENLRQKRLEMDQKVTIKKAASLTNLNEDYLGRIERGEKLPSVHTIFQLFIGLGISIDEIFTEVYMQIEILKKNGTNFHIHK